MREANSQELPYDKFISRGAESLSEIELLAIIIRTGTKEYTSLDLSKKVFELSNTNNGLLDLHHITLQELMTIKGIGQVKAIKIKSLAELSSRIASKSAKEKLSFQKPSTIANYYMEQMRHKETEQVVLIMVDGKNHLIEDYVLSIGTINASLLSPREVFVKALKCNAAYILLLHNHPSGDPTPSKQDIVITSRVKEVAAIVEIPLIDHIIIGDNKYTSFKQLGLL